MSDSGRLDSWKQIAEYIGRDVRTAIRWEDERGLPVHRVPGGRRGVVFAYASEIDRWRDGLPPNGVAPHPARTRGAGSTTGTSADSGRGTAVADSPSIAPRSSEKRTPGRLVRLGTGLVVVALLATGAAAVRLIGRTGTGPASPPGLGRVEIEPRALVVLTEAGGVAWKYEFDGPLEDLPVEGFGRRYAIADLDGDGREEVVATVTRSLETGILQDELLCFNSTGDVRWRTRLEDRVAFRSGTFGPPWFNGRVAVYSVAGQPRIAWARPSSRGGRPSWRSSTAPVVA